MTWTMYRVEFRLLSPIHVGYFKHSNVQYTRRYVTGKTIWGALTARLARDEAGWQGQYQQVGNLVQEDLAFSYFYFVEKDQEKILWPWEGCGNEEFTWRYLHTYASTALDCKTQTAQPGSLHETEYIAPITRDGAQVHLRGYIFERKTSLPWKKVFGQLQLGGERTYGWGRVELLGLSIETETFWPGWCVDTNGVRPQLKPIEIEKEMDVYAHLNVVKTLEVRGNVEPLMGRETTQNHQHGQTLSAGKIFWTPGSRISEPPLLEIGYNGIWQSVG